LLKKLKGSSGREKVKTSLRIERRSGATTKLSSFKKNCWRLSICGKPSILKVLKRIIKDLLPVKQAMARLMLQVCVEPVKCSDVVDLVKELKRLRDKTLEISKSLAESPPRPTRTILFENSL